MPDLTTDRNDPGLHQHRHDGQQQTYLVLSEEERAKGFVRPVRNTYLHLKCGYKTSMGQVLSETYARDPYFYTFTYCSYCKTHFPLRYEEEQHKYLYNFLWEGTEEGVGS